MRLPELTEPSPWNGQTRFRLLGREHVRLASFEGNEIVRVAPEGLTLLAREAMREVSLFLRASHLEKIAAILDDPAAGPNDREVATALLENARAAAELRLPLCQDTGTATVFAWKGQRIWTGTDDAELLSRGIAEAFSRESFRSSQLAPLTLFEEVDTGNNLPAQIEITADAGDSFRFLFIAKGGGSANKTQLFHGSKALLAAPGSLERFLVEKITQLGTSACPPYRLGIAIGGSSAEACLQTVKLATAGLLDGLPAEGSASGRAFRDRALEARLLEAAQGCGLGAQLGGKYFAFEARVIRLARHAASCPIGIGVSCNADRNLLARIDREGIWIEELDHDPGRLLRRPSGRTPATETTATRIDLRQPMDQILAQLRQVALGAKVLLSGPLVVARDRAHARIAESLERGGPLPSYLRAHPIYYAGPARTPPGRPIGSIGPTTSSRMDRYAGLFQSRGGSLVTLGKGERSRELAEQCARHGGFYLGAIGGTGALIARDHVLSAAPLDFADLGMEAVLLLEVVDLPAFLLVDSAGNDLLARIRRSP
jgi:fumarate hydratase class I